MSDSCFTCLHPMAWHDSTFGTCGKCGCLGFQSKEEKKALDRLFEERQKGIEASE